MINFDVFSYVLPFISFVLDHAIKKARNITNPENGIWVFLKLLVVVYYLGIYVMALEANGFNNEDRPQFSNMYILSTINLITFPVLASGYSYALYLGKLK